MVWHVIHEDRDVGVQSRATRPRDVAIHMACELVQQSYEFRPVIGPNDSVAVAGNHTPNGSFATEPSLDLLKPAGPIPMPVGLTLRTPFLLPNAIGALAQALLMRATPVLLGPPFRATLLLPEQIGPLTHNSIEINLRLHQNVMAIPVRRNGPASANVHPGRQIFELPGRHQLRVGGSGKRLGFELGVGRVRLRGSNRYRKRVKDGLFVVQHINQTFGHDGVSHVLIICGPVFVRRGRVGSIWPTNGRAGVRVFPSPRMSRRPNRKSYASPNI